MLEEQVMAILEGRSFGDAPLLPSVRQWLDWKITNVLPRDGGTLNQYPEFMADLRYIQQIETSVEAKNRQVQEAQAKIKSMQGR